MKLAIKIDSSGNYPGGGFHYMLHPMAMRSDREADIFRWMGHTIIEVSDEQGVRLLDSAGAALNHQIEIAILCEKLKV